MRLVTTSSLFRLAIPALAVIALPELPVETAVTVSEVMVRDAIGSFDSVDPTTELMVCPPRYSALGRVLIVGDSTTLCAPVPRSVTLLTVCSVSVPEVFANSFIPLVIVTDGMFDVALSKSGRHP